MRNTPAVLWTSAIVLGSFKETQMTTIALSPAKMLLFAFAAGAMVANMYYLQPILGLVSSSFNEPISTSGLLVSLGQIGYTFGILLIVPLGDVLERRTLLALVFGINATALLTAAISSNFAVFSAAVLISGATSSAAMLIVPFVASIAPIEKRGRLVGLVMTGALLAIPLSWVVSGGIGNVAGWRVLYGIAGVAVIGLLFMLRHNLPSEPDRRNAQIRYGSLLSSILQIALAQPRLRQRALYGAIGMVCFSSLWTGLPILLSQSPYNFSPAAIGLFGLTGVAGALIPGLVGRLNDKGYTGQLTVGLALLMSLAWASLIYADTGLWVIVLAAIGLNVAVMGLQITHQSVIYKLDPAANSRITAVFVSVNFVGASIGSSLASIGVRAFGWTGLCALGALIPLFLLVHFLIAERSKDARDEKAS